MTKKMLISSHGKNQIRVAFIEDQKLYNLEIESENNRKKKGNIYKGIVTKIEPSLDALFVNYGADKDGFLPFKEISEKYLDEFALTNGLASAIDISNIKGKDIVIQIEKEEKEGKGAALTTFLSLAGCYIVLMPNNFELEGISRHIDGRERINLKTKLNNILIPEGMGVIIRTLGFGKSMEELKWELDILLSQFKMIKTFSKRQKAPCLVYEESSLITRIVRDYLKSDISEIIIDNIRMFNLIYKYLNIIKSNFISKIKLYNNTISLFSKYKINCQAELIFKREIFLSSGGSIIIDITEALTSIDVNSSKFNKCDDIEETALQTNLEAIYEIARQLRIRDIGGLIIIDFIDMFLTENQRIIEKTLREALSIDKAKIQIGKISKFGLLEVSRQRIKASLIESNQSICYKCNGTGKIDNIDILSLNIINALEEESIKNNTSQINLELPIKIATYIINVKRSYLSKIEHKNDVRIVIIINKHLSIPNYKIYRFRFNEKKNKMKLSFKKDFFNINNSVEDKLDKFNFIDCQLDVKKVIHTLWNLSI